MAPSAPLHMRASEYEMGPIATTVEGCMHRIGAGYIHYSGMNNHMNEFM